jgi:YD repeat-containing protein
MLLVSEVPFFYEAANLHKLLIFKQLQLISFFDYNKLGLLTEIKISTGYTKKRTFDEKNRVKQISDDFGIEITYEYNAFDLIQKMTTVDGSQNFEYNNKEDLTKIIDPSKYITDYEYDNQHNLIKVIDSEKSIFNYEYTSNNQISHVLYPNGTCQTFEYDLNGQLVSEVYGK